MRGSRYSNLRYLPYRRGLVNGHKRYQNPGIASNDPTSRRQTEPSALLSAIPKSLGLNDFEG